MSLPALPEEESKDHKDYVCPGVQVAHDHRVVLLPYVNQKEETDEQCYHEAPGGKGKGRAVAAIHAVEEANRHGNDD